MITKAHNLLKDNQYIHKKTSKKRIVLHHTAGGSAKSSIDWWNKYRDRVCTPYLIDRDGTILEVYPPQYWAYALGINSSWAEKKSIHIEICNYGWLNKINDKFYTAYGREVSADKVVTYKEKHRGHFYYEKYTDAQIKSTIYLIDYLCKKFNIKISSKFVEKFWWYNKNTNRTLISHTTVRKDKSDIHPQPELIKAIYDYAGCTKLITE